MSNPLVIVQLFKLELGDMFNSWEASKPLRTGAPHASSILQSESDWCTRRQVLSALYPDEAERPETKPWSAHTNAVFLNGWLLHEKYQRLFSDHGTIVEVETSHFDETRFLHFTPDAIVEFGGETFVVEIKGYKAETFDDLDEAGPPPTAAHHQCNLYCHLLGIENGLVLVENKNTQHYKVWCIQVDHELAKQYTDRMYSVKGKVATGTVPTRPCLSGSDRRAQACQMKNCCFSMKG